MEGIPHNMSKQALIKLENLDFFLLYTFRYSTTGRLTTNASIVEPPARYNEPMIALRTPPPLPRKKPPSGVLLIISQEKEGNPLITILPNINIKLHRIITVAAFI